jgi:uncharacterized membrane protein
MTGYEFCGGYWWLFPLVMVLLCFLFMGGCAGRMCGFRPRNGRAESALDILNKRNAKGEIDQGEYEEKKRVLQNQ